MRNSQRTFGLGLAMAALCPFTAARSQSDARIAGGVDVGAIAQRDDFDGWSSAYHVAPTLRIDGRFVQIAGLASLLGRSSSARLANGQIDALLVPAPIGPFRLSVRGRGEQLYAADSRAETRASGEVALSFARGAGGAWLGTAFEGSTATRDSALVRPMLRFGLWHTVAGVTLTATSGAHSARLGGRASNLREVSIRDSVIAWSFDLQHRDSVIFVHYFDRPVVVGDSAIPSRLLVWSDVELAASWSRGPMAFDAVFGARPTVDNNPRALWGRMSAAWQLSPRIALVASGGTVARRIGVGTREVRSASLALRVAPPTLLRPRPLVPIRTIATEFSVRPIGADRYVVRLRVPRARVVELSGDFGKWAPVRLTESQHDIWETTLTIPAGSYRVNIRVDGDRWTAPPGLAVMEDEFNGTVGIMVVR